MGALAEDALAGQHHLRIAELIMPISFGWGDYFDGPSLLQRERRKANKKKYDEVVRLWKARKISWNEYCRLEKKYRVA